MHDTLKPIVDWLRERNPEFDEIPPDLDLIENRLVDSLGFMEFILLLEDVVGRELPVTELSVDQFRTLDTIEENFFGGERSW
ncbi:MULTISPECIES: acyl carrier protein [Protofrankia]|uniref:Acetyl xylan esterase n=1 Tax=Protofrankia coriariae TaxID=1562887 RepID=A0ABR5EYX6_9ACTN|nr:MULTISPECIES: acyl carrier protein [Protofrankia]KLL09656.1 acetyl xylan esterase [Protofrankia coriariae]ONH32337.1 acetyl xylan esterase [Protofrankia sp. BMG5.30]